MAGRIVHGRDHRGRRTLSADVVVCGGGAGGAMAARELARAGHEVLLLEEGGDHLPGDFTQREDEMIPKLFQEHGGRATDDLAIRILSGRGLGGSTIHNTNLCKRTAPEILAHWRDDLGIAGVAEAEMAPFFAEVERDLGVVPIPLEQINPHNAAIRRGTERMGWRGAVLSHNRQGCIASGFCELGCTYDAKLNARKVLIPQAVAAGATVWSDVRVDRVVLDGARAGGVRATVLDGRGRNHGAISVRARAVCLAGSAIGSASIALASDLPDPYAQLGRNLRIHPAAIIAGVFAERLESWKGIPQSWECTEHLDLRPGSDKRAWLVPSFAHPVGAASLTPGFGPSMMRAMRAYPRTAALAAMIHDETAGRVYRDGDRTRIAYVPDASDRAQLALGARAGARLLLAAGAREVVIPAQPAIRIRREAHVDGIDADRFVPHDAKLTAVHPMGTLRMGRDPQTSVVDERGEHHAVPGLWVVDGSLFPTSIGGPPQISIFAFAMKVARTLAREISA
jgi:choline dehydrogenase-like flavoprotein